MKDCNATTCTWVRRAAELEARVAELEEAIDIAADALLSEEYLHRTRLGAMLQRTLKKKETP